MEEKQEQADTKLVLTTIKAMGSQLSVGTAGKGKLDKSIQFREMETEDERLIARKTKENTNMGEQISIVLAQMADRFGEHDFTEMKFPERLLRLNQMYLADILTATILLRIESIGPKFDIEFKCSCVKKRPVPMSVDLSSTVVACAKEETDMVWEYVLDKPRVFRDINVKSLMISSPRWQIITNVMPGAQQKEIELETVRACVVGFNGQAATLFDFQQKEFDRISRRDLAGIISEMDEHVVGPHMRMDLECPNCSAEQRIPIDWRYGNFFSVSSQSKRSRT